MVVAVVRRRVKGFEGLDEMNAAWVEMGIIRATGKRSERIKGLVPKGDRRYQRRKTSLW